MMNNFEVVWHKRGTMDWVTELINNVISKPSENWVNSSFVFVQTIIWSLRHHDIDREQRSQERSKLWKRQRERQGAEYKNYLITTSRAIRSNSVKNSATRKIKGTRKVSSIGNSLWYFSIYILLSLIKRTGWKFTASLKNH